MITNVTPSIIYAGVDDTALDLFESQYPTPGGMAYNSYVIIDKEIAILDTVDSRMAGQWLDNIEEALAGRVPDYLIVHHLEPDHSSEITTIMRRFPEMKIVASKAALRMLPGFCDGETYENRSIGVGDGSTLNLGEHTLRFITAPMVHWPEVIVSVDEKEKILFSSDAFGRFDTVGPDIFNADDWADSARRYYYNIIGKYGPQVQSLLKKLAGTDISIICPLHGPVLTETATPINLYDKWSKYEYELNGVFIPYGSIYGGTARAAMELAKILLEKGVKDVGTLDLTRTPAFHAVAEAFRYRAMVVAGASYDADLFPPVYDFLHKLGLKNYNNRTVGLIENGSWAPTAARVMKGQLTAMRSVNIIEPTVTIKSRMTAADLQALNQLADAIINQLTD